MGIFVIPPEALSVVFGLLARMRAMPWQVGIPPPPARAYGIGKKMHCQSQCEKSAKVCDWQTLYKAGNHPPPTNCGNADDELWQRRIKTTAHRLTPTDGTRRHAMPDSKIIRCLS